MSKDFDKLINEIEAEAREDGPEAERHVGELKREFRVANQLIELRRQHGLTQRQLARRSGIDQSEISRIETGVANPTHATLAAIAAPLDAEVGFIPATHARRA
jgi:DNA-binding XRE family transcriptional regulator